MAAVTYAQVAALETEPLKKGIILNLIRYSKVLNSWPFDNVNSLTNIAVRAKSLPNAGFRRINEGYSTTTGSFEQVTESVYAFGGDIQFDRVWDITENYIQKPRVAQTMLKLKAMAMVWNDYLINGDHAVDEDGFEGLKKRVSNLPSRQLVNPTAVSDAALNPTASVSDAIVWLDKLDESFAYCNDGAPAMILGNQATLLGFIRPLRKLQASATAGFLDVTQDVLGRQITTFRGVPLVDMGLKRDQSTEIIGNAENIHGGSNESSLYFVSHDAEQGVRGIQINTMDIYDPLAGGEMEAGPQKLLRVDWWNGLAMYGSYGLLQMQGFVGGNAW